MYLLKFKHLTTLDTLYCRYDQFDIAKETFEVIADYESLLDLFICHLNPSSMRRLAKKKSEILSWDDTVKGYGLQVWWQLGHQDSNRHEEEHTSMGASWGSNSIYLDLSVLGVPNTDSRKPHGQPTSPASVNPHLIPSYVFMELHIKVHKILLFLVPPLWLLLSSGSTWSCSTDLF